MASKLDCGNVYDDDEDIYDDDDDSEYDEDYDTSDDETSDDNLPKWHKNPPKFYKLSRNFPDESRVTALLFAIVEYTCLNDTKTYTATTMHLACISFDKSEEHSKIQCWINSKLLEVSRERVVKFVTEFFDEFYDEFCALNQSYNSVVIDEFIPKRPMILARDERHDNGMSLVLWKPSTSDTYELPVFTDEDEEEDHEDYDGDHSCVASDERDGLDDDIINDEANDNDGAVHGRGRDRGNVDDCDSYDGGYDSSVCVKSKDEECKAFDNGSDIVADEEYSDGINDDDTDFSERKGLHVRFGCEGSPYLPSLWGAGLTVCLLARFLR